MPLFISFLTFSFLHKRKRLRAAPAADVQVISAGRQVAYRRLVLAATAAYASYLHIAGAIGNADVAFGVTRQAIHRNIIFSRVGVNAGGKR